ncbi:WD40/YVTN/BNR-like repeat-containing protein, partial [Lacihabitans soyangensis]
MKRLLLFILFTTSLSQLTAQDISVDILQQGKSFADSSYYDIIKVEDKFWVAGKYGILKSLDAQGNIENISYPTEGLDIYKLENLDNQTVLASGDKGTLYIHDLKTKAWKTIKVRNYENACFYNLAVDNQKNIFLSGGNSKIAHSGKSIPNGFVLVSSDMGQTWRRIYKNTFNMVWC